MDDLEKLKAKLNAARTALVAHPVAPRDIAMAYYDAHQTYKTAYLTAQTKEQDNG